MSWFFNIKDSVANYFAGVDANNNLKVNLPTTPSEAGYTHLAGKDNVAFKATGPGYFPVSSETRLFVDTVEGTTLNSNKWNTSVSGMTITQANGFINVNAAASVTVNNYAILKTIKTFVVTSCQPLHIHLDLQSSRWNLPAGQVAELMWGACATNAAPTDGMGIRIRAGTLYLVVNNAGTEVEQAVATLPTNDETSGFVLNLLADKIMAYRNGDHVGTLEAPAEFAAATNANRQSIYLRVYNTASAPSSSGVLKLGQISVQQQNAQWNQPWSQIMAADACGGYQSAVTPFGQTANSTNSAAPTAAALSNTAASYTTLGGKFLLNAITGAETDFALFGYLAERDMMVTGVSISAYVETALGNSSVVMEWEIGVNSSGVSLATASPWQPRRMAMGCQGFPANSAVGVCAQPINETFDAGVNGGRYVHIILRIPKGVNSGAIRGQVFVKCYKDQ